MSAVAVLQVTFRMCEVNTSIPLDGAIFLRERSGDNQHNIWRDNRKQILLVVHIFECVLYPRAWGWVYVHKHAAGQSVALVR